MASSRRSPPAERLAAAVARSLADLADGSRVAIALSGGRDSIALADTVARLAAAQPGRVRPFAIHVHHGLSASADDWMRHCERFGAARGLPLVIRRVVVNPADRQGVEAAARGARYAALADVALAEGAREVLLAHHQDDQAETLLLQLGRGAGPHGLAAMAQARRDPGGVTWMRPFLALPRACIEDAVRELGLDYVDDDSNNSARHRRNALRLHAVPALRAVFPGYPATFARAAAHQADAAQLADDLARIDAQAHVHGAILDRAGLASLPAHRARNLLRHFLAGQQLRAPSADRLAAMLAQLTGARDDAQVRLRHGGREIGIHRGGIVVHVPSPPQFSQPWRGETRLALPHGTLSFVPDTGRGLDPDRLRGQPVIVRSRAGGERMRLDPRRPRRALKAWLQESGLAPWEREALPLVFCGDALAAVPGLGVDPDWAAGAGCEGLRVAWTPH